MTAPDAPLVLSLGDPAGIGPEIVAGAWRALKASGPAFAVLGDADVLAPFGPVERISDPALAGAAFGSALPVLHSPIDASVTPGKGDPAHAAAILRWIDTGVTFCLEGRARALVTAPIAKAPLYEAGFSFPGHTEYLAELTKDTAQDGPRGPVMMLATDDLRVVLTTIHIPLAKVVSELSVERVVEVGRVTAAALTRDFGFASPRLAMAGLNPHAGEGGAIGREEIEILNPAAAALRAMGIDCSDARPADTLFHAEARARYDAVIAHYHDQALIPIKTLDFYGGVNVTLGLPIVRTSPDHGVGYDIAGKGVARADSLISALRLAGRMADLRHGAT